MKWYKCENEIKELEFKYQDALEKIKNGIWLFGSGTIGKKKKTVFELSSFDIKGFIDNDITIRGTTRDGAQVISFSDYINNYRKDLIIISVGERNIKQIISQVESVGLKIGIDYIVDERDLLALAEITYNNRLYIPLVQISLTERCTLKCKKCAHGCNMVSSDCVDLSIDEVKRTCDEFFKLVDYCGEFVFIGGEPLLYKDLPEVVEYIGNNYRDKIATFSITTNGTIIPSTKQRSVCRENNVTFFISNYSATIPRIENNLTKLTNMLGKENILFNLGSKETQWIDYGFGEYDRGNNEDELINTFDSCHTECHEIRGSRFYYCVMARSVSENKGFNVGQKDYLELSELEGVSGKRKFYVYSMGFSDKGYLDMCRFCRGGNNINTCYIPAAEQDSSK